MDRTALQVEIRSALELADELSRHEHARGEDTLSAHLAGLRTLLWNIDGEVGRTHDGPLDTDSEAALAIDESARWIEGYLASAMRRATTRRSLTRALRRLVVSARRVACGLAAPTRPVPSKPVLGHLPLARIVPQDVHSVCDYASGIFALASMFFARTRTAKVVGANLFASALSAAKLTDHRLGVFRVFPIEAHEGFDHVWGLAAITSPFVFGYVRRDPVASALQIAFGVGQLCLSLVTNYEGTRGEATPRRSRGGPLTVATKAENLERFAPQNPPRISAVRTPRDAW